MKNFQIQYDVTGVWLRLICKDGSEISSFVTHPFRSASSDEILSKWVAENCLEPVTEDLIEIEQKELTQ